MSTNQFFLSRDVVGKGGTLRTDNELHRVSAPTIGGAA
jgi:hypothetical protein